MESGSNKDLTSTMGGLMSSTSSTNPENKEDDRENSNDSTPTSSTDASTTASKSQIVTEDPISSTSSDTPPEAAITTSPATSSPLGKTAAAGSSSGAAAVFSAAAPPTTPPMSSTLSSGGSTTAAPTASTSIVSEKDMLDLNITDTSPEKITENVDDIVQDLEILLGEPTTSFDYVPREGRRSGGKTAGVSGSTNLAASSVVPESAMVQADKELLLGDVESLKREFESTPEVDASAEAKQETDAYPPAEPVRRAEKPQQDESPLNESQPPASPSDSKSDKSEILAEQTADQKSPDDRNTANGTLAEDTKLSETAIQETVSSDAEVQPQNRNSKDETSPSTTDAEILAKQKEASIIEIEENRTKQTDDVEEIPEAQVHLESSQKSPPIPAEIEDVQAENDAETAGKVDRENPTEMVIPNAEQVETIPESQHTEMEQECLAEVHAEPNSREESTGDGVSNNEQETFAYSGGITENKADPGDNVLSQDTELPVEVTGNLVEKSNDLDASEPMEVDQDEKTTSVSMDVDQEKQEVDEDSGAETSHMDVVEEIPDMEVTCNEPSQEIAEEISSEVERLRNIEELPKVEEPTSKELTQEVFEEIESASPQKTEGDSQEAETVSREVASSPQEIEDDSRKEEIVIQEVASSAQQQTEDYSQKEETVTEEVAPPPQEAEDDLPKVETLSQEMEPSPQEDAHSLQQETDDSTQKEETVTKEVALAPQETQGDSQKEEIVTQEVAPSPQETKDELPKEETISQEMEPTPQEVAHSPQQETDDSAQKEETVTEEVAHALQETQGDSQKEEIVTQEVAPSSQETEDESPKEETMIQDMEPSPQELTHSPQQETDDSMQKEETVTEVALAPQETEGDSQKEEIVAQEVAPSSQETEDESPKEETRSQDMGPSPQEVAPSPQQEIEDYSQKEETVTEEVALAPQETEGDSQKEEIVTQEVAPSPQETEDESPREETMSQEMEPSSQEVAPSPQQETGDYSQREETVTQKVALASQETEGDSQMEEILTQEVAPSPQETEENLQKEETVSQQVDPSPKETEGDSMKAKIVNLEVAPSPNETKDNLQKEETMSQEAAPLPKEIEDDSPNEETTSQEVESSPQKSEDDRQKETITQEMVPSPQADESRKEETMSQEVKPSPQRIDDDSQDTLQKETVSQKIVPSPQETENDSPEGETTSQEVEPSPQETEDNSQNEVITQEMVSSPQESDDESPKEITMGQAVESSPQETEDGSQKEAISQEIILSPRETEDKPSEEEPLSQEVEPSPQETVNDSQKETTQGIVLSPQEIDDGEPKVETMSQEVLPSPKATEDASQNATNPQEIVSSAQKTEDDLPKEETMSQEVVPSPRETEDGSQDATVPQENVSLAQKTEDDSPKEEASLSKEVVPSSQETEVDSQTEETASQEVSMFDPTQTTDSVTTKTRKEENDVDQFGRVGIVTSAQLELMELADETYQEKFDPFPERIKSDNMETHVNAEATDLTMPVIPLQIETIDDSNKDENTEEPAESGLDSRRTGEELDETNPVLQKNDSAEQDVSESDQITQIAEELEIDNKKSSVEPKTEEDEEIEASQGTETVPEITEQFTSEEVQSEPQDYSAGDSQLAQSLQKDLPETDNTTKKEEDSSQVCGQQPEPTATTSSESTLEIPAQEGLVDSEKDQVVDAEENKIVEQIHGTKEQESNLEVEEVKGKPQQEEIIQHHLENIQANEIAKDSIQQIETQSNLQVQSTEVDDETLKTKDEEPELGASVVEKPETADVDTRDAQIGSSNQLECTGDLIKSTDDTQSVQLVEPSIAVATEGQQVSQDDGCELMETEGSPSSLIVEVSGKSLDGLTENVEALEISESVETMEVDENLETNQEWDKPEPKLSQLQDDSTSSESSKSSQEVQEAEQVIVPRRTSVGLSLPILDDEDSDEKRPSKAVTKKVPQVSHKVEANEITSSQSDSNNLSRPIEIDLGRSQAETSEIKVSSPVQGPTIEPPQQEESPDLRAIPASSASETDKNSVMGREIPAKIEPSMALSLPILTESDDLDSNEASTKEEEAIHQQQTDLAIEALTITSVQVEVQKSVELTDASEGLIEKQDAEIVVLSEASGIVTLDSEDPTKLEFIQDADLTVAVEGESSTEDLTANRDVEKNEVETEDALRLNFERISSENSQTAVLDSDSNNAQLETLSDDLNNRVSDVLLSSHIEDDTDKITSDIGVTDSLLLSSQIEETETLITPSEDLMTTADDVDDNNSVISEQIQEDVTYSVMDEMPQDLDNLESLLAAAASDIMNNAQDIQEKHSAELMEAGGDSSNLPEDDLAIDDILREKAADISPGQSQETPSLEDQQMAEQPVGSVENEQTEISEIIRSDQELGVEASQAQDAQTHDEAPEVAQQQPLSKQESNLADDAIDRQKIPVDKEPELETDKVPLDAVQSSAQTTDSQASKTQEMVTDIAQNEASAIKTDDTKPKTADLDSIDDEQVGTTSPKKTQETNEINSTSQETVQVLPEIKDRVVPRTVHSESQRSPDSTKLKEPLLISIMDDAADKDKCHSPKVSIKPVVKSPASSAEEPASTSHDSSEDRENKGSLKMTITKQSDTMHSILKICSPTDNNSEATPSQQEHGSPGGAEPTVPKLILKSSRVQSSDKQHSPKVTSSVAKQQQSPDTTVLKVCSPDVEKPETSSGIDSSSPEPTVPKLIIKPVVEQQHSPKMSTRSTKQQQVFSPQRSASPRITIKPIVKPEIPEAVNPLKITIKPVLKSDEGHRQKHSPKLSIKPVVKHPSAAEEETSEKVHSPRVTIKPIVKPQPSEEESSVTGPRVTIKPIVKPQEEQVSVEHAHSPRITIKPIVRPSAASNNESSSTSEVGSSTGTTPRLTIKPIPKPTAAEKADKTGGGGDVVEKQEQQVVQEKGSPRITIKPIVKPVEIVEIPSDSDDEEEKIKERIVLKINKKGNNKESASSTTTSASTTTGGSSSSSASSRKREHPPDDEKSEKLAKIKFKFSKQGHPHIVQQQRQQQQELNKQAREQHHNKRASPDSERTNNKRFKADSDSLDAMSSTTPGHAHQAAINVLISAADSAPTQSIGRNSSTTISSSAGDSIKDNGMDIVVISDDSSSQPGSTASGGVVPVSDRDPLDDLPVFEISKKDDRQSQSQSQVSSSSASSSSLPTSATKKQETAITTAVSAPVTKETIAAAATTPTPPSAPRKRGRPRKVPLEVREEFKDVPPAKEEEPQKPPSSPQQPSSSERCASSSPGASSPNAESSLSPLTSESSRPKRSCRGAQQSVRTTLGIKPRKPRGPGRGRGGKRGMGTRSTSPPPPLAPPTPPPPSQKEQQRGGKDHHPAPRGRRGGRGGASAVSATTSVPVVQLTDLAQCEAQQELPSTENLQKKDTPVLEAEPAERNPETAEEKNFLGKVPPPASAETAPSKEPTGSTAPVEAESVESTVAGPSDEQPSPVASASASTADRADIVMYEEETRMSAERGSRGQTPAKQEDIGSNSNQLPDIKETQTLSLSESMRLPRMLTPPTALAALYSTTTPPASSSGGVVICSPSPTKPATCNLLTPSRGARRKWSLEDNLDIMRSYYLGTECDRNKQGYRKRSLQEWRKLRPDMPLQEHQLANQMYAIRTHNLLTEVQMADCKREVEQILRGRKSPVLGQNDDEESMLSTPKPGSPFNMSVDMMVSNVDIEESQSSVQSSATTESAKVRRSAAPRSELHQEPDVGMISADQLAEYYWNGGGPFMLQEQVAQFLGIKSFKRKYPNIARRAVDMQERDFIKESNLAAESMCDLGLTAVSSADILDIMYSDFQEKYEEYCKHQRDRQALDLINKQKALNLAASQEKTKKDLMRQAVQSTASWNAGFNKTRRTQRKACMDLQTFTVHYPKGKLKQINKGKMGDYPVAVVPGQFTDHYKEFTPTEINNMPINTMCYEPIERILPPQQDMDCDSQSDGSGSDSDSSSSGGSDSSYSGSSDENCTLCNKHQGTKKSVSATQ